MTGMLDPAAGLDNECPGNKPLKVAAIINFQGITDVNDLLSGPNQKSYAVKWLGSLAEAQEVAKRVSPRTYVRKGLPPILTIHGDADPTVPYQHAVRLKQALDQAGVPNELLTIPGGKYGGFSDAEMLKVQKTIDQFLRKHHILSGASQPPKWLDWELESLPFARPGILPALMRLKGGSLLVCRWYGHPLRCLPDLSGISILAFPTRVWQPRSRFHRGGSHRDHQTQLACVSQGLLPQGLLRLEPSNGDLVTDFERHQVFAHLERPAIGLSGFGYHIVDLWRGKILPSDEYDM